jgi:hypothetical protein
VQAAFAAFELSDWQALAATVHPDRLASFQREVLAYLVGWAGSKDARAQAAHGGNMFFAFTYDDSLLPEALPAVANVKIPIFPRESTIGELAKATYGGDTELGKDTSAFRRDVIGQVTEGDTLAHVLYRPRGLARRAEQVERMPVKRFGDGWGLLLNQDIGSISLFALRLNER